MNFDITAVRQLADYDLELTFRDGTRGTVSFRSTFFTGVFSRLGDPRVFADHHLEHGAIAWGADLDLAPDALHERLRSAPDHRIVLS